MFYNQFIKICKERNIKPSPVLKEIGLSSGNLTRWETGSNVNYETLEKVSAYFNVPVDYFFYRDEDSISPTVKPEKYNSLYKVAKTHPDYIMSLTSAKTISSSDLEKISKYLNCSPNYLIAESAVIDDASDTEDNIPPIDKVLNIMAKLADSNEYRCLQVRISTIVINNLQKKNFTPTNLIEIGLDKNKVRNLYDMSMPADKKIGLNFSDFMNISGNFKVSYDYMLTGIGD